MSASERRFTPRIDTEISVSNFSFYLYLYYMVSFLLHIPARIPAISVIRPDLLIAVTLLISLFMQQQKLIGRFDNPCNKYLLIFLAYSILSLPFVEWPGSVLRGNLTEVIKACLFFYFTILIVDTDVRLKRFIFVFVSCQLFRVLEPLYLHEAYGYWGSQTFLGDGEFADRLGGAPSDVINPNGLAFVIATVFPFLHFVWGNSRWISKLAYFLLILPLLYALVLTMSRSGMIAMLVITGSIFLKSRHKIILIIVSILIAVMTWTNMSDVQRERYLSLTGEEDVRGAGTAQSRMSGIKSEFMVALQKPIFGYGLGTSKEALFNVHGGTHVAHNLYNETFIETGIIGLIIFILFLKSIYKTLKQVSKNLSTSSTPHQDTRQTDKKNAVAAVPLKYENNLMLALSACFWMYLVFSIAQYGLREYHWYLLAGIVTVLNRRTNRHLV